MRMQSNQESSSWKNNTWNQEYECQLCQRRWHAEDKEQMQFDSSVLTGE